eukprot:10957937-Lingulodinium_polyedra.AAC.1
MHCLICHRWLVPFIEFDVAVFVGGVADVAPTVGQAAVRKGQTGAGLLSIRSLRRRAAALVT